MMKPEAMTETDPRWQAIAERRAEADGQFVYGVATTGVYCRPSCRSRQPRPANVEYFPLPAAAEAAGYRPCKRCRPQQVAPVDERLRLVQQVCDYIHGHLETPEALTLKALGEAVGYHPQHLGAAFKAALGLTPRQYADGLRWGRFKRALRGGGSVTEAVYAAGYGSSSRVYERSDAALGMTPAAYQKGGAGMTLDYTVVQQGQGDCWLLAMTARGVCAVGLYDDTAEAEAALAAEFPRAERRRDDARLAGLIERITAHIEQAAPLDLPLDILATAFQQRVWAALRAIPRGETRTYAQVAASIGQPSAVRAVARACASNRAAVVIPCHRVIGSDGALTGYRWGVGRKARLLAKEQQ